MSLNPTSIITPAQAKETGDKHGDQRSIEFWRALARRKPKACMVCGQPEWKYGRAGMCFPCTTGESDSSEDYEIGLA